MRADGKRSPRTERDRVRDNAARKVARRARINAGKCTHCDKQRGATGTTESCRPCADERNAADKVTNARS